MDISSISGQNNFTSQIHKMGELLKNMTAHHMNMENKLLNIAVTEQVTGCGHNIDIKA
jgi:hypothetical protein